MRGAWIEIKAYDGTVINPGRSPCGERGLKYDSFNKYGAIDVAPHAGSVD